MKSFALILLAALMTSCIYDKNENQPLGKKPVKTAERAKPKGLQVIFPHPSDFKEQLKHGKLYLADKKSCTNCHDDSGNPARGNTTKSGPNCSSCHDAYPHEGQQKTDWIGNHGKFFKKSFPSGDPSSSTCTNCHGGDLLNKSAGLKKVSCGTCHVEMPHDTADWAYGIGSGNHHGDFIKQNGISDCRKCHGEDINQTDVNAGNQGKAQYCSTCHQPVTIPGPGPEIPERVPFPHVMKDWKGIPKGNGKHHSDFLKARGVQQCTMCHGQDINQDDMNNGQQGKAKFCGNCH